MIDSKLVEDIVQQVLSRLMEDPRFAAGVQGGYLSNTPQLLTPTSDPISIPQAGYRPVLQNQNVNPGIPRPGKPAGVPLQQNQNLNLAVQRTASRPLALSAPWFNRSNQNQLDSRPQGLNLMQQSSVYPTQRGNSTINKHHRKVLSEWDILQTHRSGGRVIAVSRSAIITPLAKDRARDLSVDIIIEQ